MSLASTLNIYTEHFGLAERPFSLVPDPDFLYWSPAHRRAFAMLEYGLVTRAPITLITGEVGAGKTTLLHHLLKSLDDGVRVGLVANAHGDRGELLRWVLLALARPVSPQAGYVDLFGQFQNYLIAEYAAGRRVVLIFDEAQSLSRESLEELRMFTNINSNKDELLQLILVGQPELRAMIRRPDLTQFAQRVTASFHLTTMDAETVKAYIAHRLAVAGGSPDIFSDEAAAAVYAETGGVPRLVNQLCDLAMVYAYAKGDYSVDLATVQQILEDGVFFAGGAASRAPAEVPQATMAEGRKGERSA
jgi:general secretion pathway protein A